MFWGTARSVRDPGRLGKIFQNLGSALQNCKKCLSTNGCHFIDGHEAVSGRVIFRDAGEEARQPAAQEDSIQL